MNEILNMAYDAAMQHIPHAVVWVPQVGTAVVGVLGLALLIKGARLFPAIIALIFMGGGGLAGTYVADAFGTMLWPTVIVLGVVGFALGYFLFKVWLAALVGGCLAAIALTLYGAKVVSPHIENFSSSNLKVEQGVMGVSIPDSGAAPVANGTPSSWAEQAWTHLSTVVPNFQTSFWTILVSVGLAGLVFGFLLPKVARSLVAATVGSVLFLIAVLMLLRANWPGALQAIDQLGEWRWIIITGLWGISLLYNLFDFHRKPRPAASVEEPEAAGAAPA